MRVKGMLDRFENDQAVILLEDRNEEIIVHTKDLPVGSKKNTCFHIDIHNGRYTILSIDTRTTKEQKQQSNDLMKELKAKKKRQTTKKR